MRLMQRKRARLQNGALKVRLLPVVLLGGVGMSARYTKFYVAILGAVGQLAVELADIAPNIATICRIVVATATAAGVFAFPNKPDELDD